MRIHCSDERDVATVYITTFMLSITSGSAESVLVWAVVGQDQLNNQ